jgi:hypothetical protein
MRDRKISLPDLNQRRIWIESRPKCRKESGTKISARSSSVVKAKTRKLFFLQARLQRARSSRDP